MYNTQSEFNVTIPVATGHRLNKKSKLGKPTTECDFLLIQKWLNISILPFGLIDFCLPSVDFRCWAYNAWSHHSSNIARSANSFNL